jgi:DNA topoisomerase-2
MTTTNQQATPVVQLEDFFKNEYISFSVYDNVRKLASYIDGQKNASRKILYTVLQQKVDKFVKVSNLGPRVQDYSQYLHGSLEGTIVNTTADYVGSGNNVPLLEGDGNFGSAFINDAAATRYIFARMSPMLKNLVVKDDFVNLVSQSFEGTKIEPRYYVPTIPLLAVNGSEGVSIGFAQKILPRKPREIAKWVRQKAEGKRVTADLTPHWEGMKCTVEKGETNVQWLIKGSFTRKTKHRFHITSIPIGYTLKQYQAVLDKLVEDKVIKDYDDLSDNDEFEFEIHVDRGFSERDDESVLNKLKLIKRVSENFTCVDEDNKIRIFDSLKQLLEAWYEVRISYNKMRKDYLLQKMQEDKDLADAKIKFIKGVIEEKIELRNQAEATIVKQAEAYAKELEGRVEKFLTLPMRSLTKEEVARLRKKSAELKQSIDEYSVITLEEIALDDLRKLNL